MAAIVRDFGSPKTASVQEVDITGTLGTDASSYNVTVTLAITDSVASTTRYVYTTKQYAAGASYTAGSPDKLYLAIIPALNANETVALSIAGDGGAFEGNIDIA